MGISKSKQSSSTSNQAYPFLQSELGGSVSSVGQGIQGISDLLSGDTTGFNAFKSATGFNQELSRGLSDITGAGAARGLLRSGSTSRGLMDYGQELQNRTAQNYIQNLLGMGQLGLGAAGVIGGAGQTSQSKGSSKGLSFNPPSGFGG